MAPLGAQSLPTAQPPTQKFALQSRQGYQASAPFGRAASSVGCCRRRRQSMRSESDAPSASAIFSAAPIVMFCLPFSTALR